jgi:hypothetical protein
LAYQRRATDEELQLALEYLDNNPQRMISLCRAILNSSEFLYMD